MIWTLQPSYEGEARLPRAGVPVRLTTPALMLTLAAALCLAFLALVTSPALAVEKGVSDVRLEGAATKTGRAALVEQIASQLKTHWVRLMVSWDDVEPRRDVYDAAELRRLDALVNELRAQNVQVILTTYQTPEWAQQRYWWKHPLPGHSAGPQHFYPVRTSDLGEYDEFGQFLATHFAGRVQALECWNEPNFWCFLYPQRTLHDAHYGARTYLTMLRAFSAGVRRAGTGVSIIAGATASLGDNNRYRTSPQSFARYLKDHGAASLFDIYSHHPYVPGGTANPAPDRAPAHPKTTVTLGNLGTLLRIFPDKPFYLTEYGYQTRPSVYFGYLKVTPAVQARYLTTAYSYLRRYPQVKLLIWYLLYDWRPREVSADRGIYSGLRSTTGTRKPAWYAFRDVP
jgi:hypothetical protein